MIIDFASTSCKLNPEKHIRNCLHLIDINHTVNRERVNKAIYEYSDGLRNSFLDYDAYHNRFFKAPQSVS